VKVTVDQNKCSGHARCAAVGADFWELDDLGYNALSGKGAVDVPPQFEQQATDGAAACPERAITIS
jgi:ferredoxin